MSFLRQEQAHKEIYFHPPRASREGGSHPNTGEKGRVINLNGTHSHHDGAFPDVHTHTHTQTHTPTVNPQIKTGIQLEAGLQIVAGGVVDTDK